MNKPRYRRRKADRPQEITAAAFDAFAENGYAATRVTDVAKRAGVSKGLMYLYFKTKEELFKSVIKSVVVRRVDALVAALETTDLSSEAFLRGPALAFMKGIPGSPVAVVIRLLIAEASRHPDLAEYYYENVAAKGLGALRQFVERGIERGEFRKCPASEFPHLFLAPVLLGVVWRIVFSRQSLDTDRLIETQVDLLLEQLRS